ncbi:hypothetical protein PBRA_002365 [Plasmodiophora brassicae]|uniref:Uncharacterized protein n=1 Tax=Plasmodiophora brassicae TaxID=37360 RepID=A0A0G4J447_PLABS|nr:hypothetical protein PBRA_002365 [Plasmodiophora brassicae]
MVVVITGGFSGFGAAVARRLLETSPTSRVCVVDRKPLDQAGTVAALQRQFGSDRVLIVPGVDVTSYESFAGAFLQAQRFGPVIGVVNNAGLGEGSTVFNGPPGSDAAVDAKAWRRTIDVDLLGVVFGVALALRYAADGCSVVNVASLAGLIPMSIQPVYSAAKAGVIMLTKAAARSSEARRRDIAVSCICPGFVDTALLNDGKRAVDGFTEAVSSAGTVPIDVVVTGIVALLNDRPNGRVVLASPKRGLIDATRPGPKL